MSPRVNSVSSRRRRGVRSTFFQLAASLALIWAPLAHAAVKVNSVRMWPAPDHTRLVFDVSAPVEHRLSTLSDPLRLVIDMDDAQLRSTLDPIGALGNLVGGVRAAPHGKDLRVVIDLKTAVKPRAFLLPPYEQYGHRLVVDLFDAQGVHELPELPLTTAPSLPQAVELVIAIDAGHGGEDPGAIGPRRTREKEVVLEIARELKRQIDATPGMRAVLVRDGDYYIPLRTRIERAHQHRPDAFISIHADAIPGRRKVQGSSVYVLSERGATREASYLAAKENASDLIGGVRFDGGDDVVNKVLVDMSQSGTIISSLELGADLLAELKRVGPVHSRNVGQAGFFVLRSPYIPSVLIETAFISNPDEERKLRDKGFQRRLAGGIVQGLKRAAPRLLARRVPETVPVAAPNVRPNYHVVRAGETLTEIARQYETNVEALRFLNNLHGDAINAGLKLELPPQGS